MFQGGQRREKGDMAQVGEQDYSCKKTEAKRKEQKGKNVQVNKRHEGVRIFVKEDSAA
jgi:hypothetical protein